MDPSPLRRSNVLQSLRRLSAKHGKGIYLVGGAVRDLVLGRPWDKDLDFVTAGDVRAVSKDLSAAVDGHAFSLNDSFGTWRVVIKNARKKIDVDLSPMQGREILADLEQRDFTINSMAFDVEEIFGRKDPPLLDPLNGISDLKRRMLRANSEESIRRDPLRMLRAYRLAATLSFRIDPGTIESIRRNRALIRKSAWERIRDELFQVLDSFPAGRFLREMDASGLLEEIFPEMIAWRALDQGGQNPFPLLEHAFRTVEAADMLLIHTKGLWPSPADSLGQHFARKVEEGVSRRALLKFACFFHDSGKPATRNVPGSYAPFPDHDREGEKINSLICRRLKLSRKSIRIISELTRQHMRLRTLSRSPELTPRAKHRFFHDLGEEGIEMLILALADGFASAKIKLEWPLPAALPGEIQKIKATVSELLRYYHDDYSTQPKRPLLNGKEIMKGLGIAPGKEVGYLLGRLKEAEISGRVRTKKEALEYLRTLIPPA